MPPKAAAGKPAAGGKGAGARSKVSKSLKEVYEETCRDQLVHPNSAFTRLLPEKQGASVAGDTIDLTRNFVGDKGIAPVMAVVQRCPNLRKVHLNDNGLRNHGVGTVCMALSKHQGVTSIDLSDNYISKGAGDHLLKLLQDNPRITDVVINNTKIDVEQRLQIKQLAATNAQVAPKVAL